MGKLWRRLHYFSAVVAGVFILFASITGSILAIEPWLLDKIAVSGDQDPRQTFADFQVLLDESFLEVFDIEKDAYGNIKVEGIGLETDEGTSYVSASTGKILQAPAQLSPIFNLSRDLHRSLFLKTPGRILVGISSLALLFLALSGLGLLVKRAGGWKASLRRIRILEFRRDGHALWSRLFVIPIIIVAFSGTYLAVFRLLPAPQNSVILQPKAQSAYEDILMKDVKKVIFPIEESETLAIELNGQILHYDFDRSEVVRIENLPFGESQKRFQFTIHTGEGYPLWALVLLLSSLVMIFLSITGFMMIGERLRRKSHKLQAIKKTDVYILVGSETGHTWRFADALEKAFVASGTDVNVLNMADLPVLHGEKSLIFLTSTYGDGDAPENTGNIIRQLESKLKACDVIKFCVLGFGSSQYPAFCAYAEQLREALLEVKNTFEMVPFMTVDNQSVVQYIDWVRALNKHQNLQLNIDTTTLHPTRKSPLETFSIVEKRQVGETFLLKIDYQGNQKIKSGDLVGIYPPGENIERFYSIAHLDTSEIILVVKRTGLCSGYLSHLEPGHSFEGYIKKNPCFYAPSSDRPLLMIANGTGIAPFLTTNMDNATLLWGGRYFADFELFKSYTEGKNYDLAFSREEDKAYVQDLVAGRAEEIVQLLAQNGTIMICGSLTMYEGVKKVLLDIIHANQLPSFEELKRQKRILVDCY